MDRTKTQKATNSPQTHSHLLELDFEAYAPFLEDADISDDDKRQLIEALWSVVVSFVQLGYGLSPVQQALEARQLADPACGQFAESRDSGAIPPPDPVEYNYTITQNFVSSAHADDEEGALL